MGIYTTLNGAIPKGGEALVKPFSSYIVIIDNHDQSILAARKHGMRERSGSPQEDDKERESCLHDKRAHLNAMLDTLAKPEYAWNTTSDS